MTDSGPYKDSRAIVYEDGEVSLDSTNITQVRISSNNPIHTVKDGETIHSIAYYYYRDSGKWYLIAEANHIFNPFREIHPGTKLIIPKHGS